MSHLNRTIHLDEQEWLYRIGSSHVIIAEPNSSKKHILHFKDIVPTKWAEAGGCYNYSRLSVTPADVRDYIERVIIPNKASELGG